MRFRHKNKKARCHTVKAMPDNQSGLAIISVLLIVALMVSLIAFLVEKQFLHTKRIAYSLLNERAHFALLAAESIALSKLSLDTDLGLDHYNESWARELNIIESEERGDGLTQKVSLMVNIDDMDVNIDIIDLQSRFNINNLLVNNPVSRQQQQTILLNILNSSGVDDAFLRQRLVSNLIDWLDENNLETNGGKETDYYASLNQPYSASNQAMVTKGELLSIEGFSWGIVEQLIDFVCFLPTQTAKININTASEPVLASLSLGSAVSLESLRSYLTVRENQQFSGLSKQDFTDALIAASPTNANVVAEMLAQHSNYFLFDMQLKLEGRVYRMLSTLQRSQTSQSKKLFTVIRREQI